MTRLRGTAPRFVLLVLLFFCNVSWADTAVRGAGIASAHPLADQAGYEVLEKGGNAFDAAVAVSAALAVVEPYSSGLGGGGFYLLHRADDGFSVMIDARETAPRAANRDMYLDEKGALHPSLSRQGALAAAIPGTPAALVHIAGEYGNLPLEESLVPAIRLARDGFRLDARFAAMIEDSLDLLKKHCAPGCPFLVNDRRPVKAGAQLKQPELARTLMTLAKSGGESFYQGELARQMVEAVTARGGIWSLEDLRDYRVRERAPVSGNYRGHRITTASPPSSGGVTLIETLNILSGYDLEAMSAPQRVHFLVEAWRRAYRDRNEFLGDPDFVDAPVERLIHPLYAAGLRVGIDPERATSSASLPPVVAMEEGEDTTHLSILDREGNRVAATQTVNFRFGSGVVAAGTGIVLNNEMDDFAAKPGAPNGFGLVQGEANAIAPFKRPLSSMTPTFLESERGVAILGTPGGSRIISMVALGVLEYVHGGDAEDMTSRARFHHQYLPDVIQYEVDAFDEDTINALRELGHTLTPVSRPFGNMNVVTWDRESGEVEVSHDPRNAEARVDF